MGNLSALSWLTNYIQWNYDHNDDDVLFALDQHPYIYLLVLAHIYNIPQADMLLHLDR